MQIKKKYKIYFAKVQRQKMKKFNNNNKVKKIYINQRLLLVINATRDTKKSRG